MRFLHLVSSELVLPRSALCLFVAVILQRAFLRLIRRRKQLGLRNGLLELFHEIAVDHLCSNTRFRPQRPTPTRSVFPPNWLGLRHRRWWREAPAADLRRWYCRYRHRPIAVSFSSLESQRRFRWEVPSLRLSLRDWSPFPWTIRSPCRDRFGTTPTTSQKEI